MIDGYEVFLQSVYYPTLDAAVKGIKERVAEAVIKFEPLLTIPPPETIDQK